MRKCGRICAQIPFMQVQEVVIASRGVDFSSSWRSIAHVASAWDA